MTIMEKMKEVISSENFEVDVTEFLGNIDNSKRITEYMISNIIGMSERLEEESLGLTVPKMGSQSELNVVLNTIKTIISKNADKVIVLEKIKQNLN